MTIRIKKCRRFCDDIEQILQHLSVLTSAEDGDEKLPDLMVFKLREKR